MRPRLFIAAGCVLIALGASYGLWQFLTKPEAPLTPKEKIYRGLWEEERNTPVGDTAPIPPESSFFSANKSLPLAISNEDLMEKLEQGEGLVLDAREEEEFSIGQIPNSLHIRYGDLRNGAWRQLPTDKILYVVCYSGVRGEIVASFLRERGVLAQYIEEGAVDWVDFGGSWTGEIDFYGVYNDERYVYLLTQHEMDEARGAVLIDSRPRYKYEREHLPGARNIPLIYSPSQTLEQLFNAIPPGAPVITICDDFSSCFDATLSAIRLQKRGHPLIGVFNSGAPLYP